MANIKSSKVSQAAKKAEYIFSKSRVNGREKDFMESIYFGVGPRPYADIKDCKKAGIKILKKNTSPSGAWYYLSKKEAVKLILSLIS
jgi:hypothetical protein